MLATTALCKKLGYTFKDCQLLADALSHRSVRGKNYERLEFLGDAVLNFVIAAALFQKCPQAKEGDLSRLRASLVRGETLAELAHGFQLGDYLRLGAGELKSGGAHRSSILADAMEAIIGAIYLDGGLAICEQCILQWYAARLENSAEIPNLKDAKTRLQEYLQSRQLPLPDYVILVIEGAAHQQTFRMECRVAGFKQVAVGMGTTRKRAEQEAALKMLDLLEK